MEKCGETGDYFFRLPVLRKAGLEEARRYGGRNLGFCLFLSETKKLELFCENPLTILAFCAKIVNCIIIAFTMGTSAFRQVPESKKDDFTRRSLCNLTNMKSERSIRLRPRHLPCPWVVRLTHEVPDVPPTFSEDARGIPPYISPHLPSLAAAREFARRCHTNALKWSD